jgi:hypothetical protein
MLPRDSARFSHLLHRGLSCLLAAFWLAWTPIAAKDAGQSFAVTIAAEAPESQTGPNSYTVKAGADVFIKVHLTNTSRRKLSFGYDKDSRTNVDFFHHYEVRDNKGNSAEKRAINHPELGSTAHGWPARVLKPGESMEITGDDISLLYDLRQLDEFTIQLSRSISGDPKDGVVKSNTITVKVTR